MTQDPLRKNRLRKNEAPSAEDADRIPFTRLEDILIEDPFHEKRVFEKGGSERDLYPQRYPSPILVSADAKRRRILEVYKRCFERAKGATGEEIVSDFVAHFPDLSFDADWLNDVVRTQCALPGIGSDSNKKKILLALARGFRRAATTKKRHPAIQKAHRVRAAHTVQREFVDALTKWNVGLERSVSTPAEIAECAISKAEELANTHRQLLPGDKERLKTLLQQGLCYEASILIASRVFNVPVRDLQRKPE